MSAQLMRPGRRSTIASGVSLIAGNANCEEIREAVNGFIAYFGTFDVDESAQTVIHHVQACLVPSWVGTDLKRTYRFNASRLALTAVTTSALNLIWERELDRYDWCRFAETLRGVQSLTFAMNTWIRAPQGPAPATDWASPISWSGVSPGGILQYAGTSLTDCIPAFSE